MSIAVTNKDIEGKPTDELAQRWSVAPAINEGSDRFDIAGVLIGVVETAYLRQVLDVDSLAAGTAIKTGHCIREFFFTWPDPIREGG